jgi:hypothetical protein
VGIAAALRRRLCVFDVRRIDQPVEAASTDAAKIATFATSSRAGSLAKASSPMNRDMVKPMPATAPAPQM